jgi:transposase-like protein
VFVPRYSESQARCAVAASSSYAETLRRLGLCETGGNWRTLRIWIERWSIANSHFDSRAAQRQGLIRRPQPLDEILVEGSTYSRSHLKDRLYGEGLKERRCEICGQSENWNGGRMALILDHVNGVRDDHRIENLRIVCPNCAATFATHCGRKNHLLVEDRACLLCGRRFRPRFRRQRYCSRACGTRAPKPSRGVAKPERRRVERPTHQQLLREIAETSYLAVGRKYGVSDNAIRKWVRQYEREAAARDAAEATPADPGAPCEPEASAGAREPQEVKP